MIVFGRKFALMGALALVAVAPAAMADPPPKCFETPDDPSGNQPDGCIKYDTTDPTRPASGYSSGNGASASRDADETDVEQLAADALASPETR